MTSVRRRPMSTNGTPNGNTSGESPPDQAVVKSNSSTELVGIGSDVSVFGVRSDDCTAFMLLLVPFILSWTIGYLGFSSFFAFLVALGVYWGIFTKNRFIRKHTWLNELIGTCITGENAGQDEKRRLYRQCKLAEIPISRFPAYLVDNDQQRAEWLNVIIAQMWPFISDFIKRILRETVEPSIQTLLPKMNIQFTQLCLGDKSPRIVAIKVYEQKDGDQRDRIEIDCQLAWVSSAQFKLKVMASTAEIEKLQFFGNMRITLEPLLSEPPLVGAMSFTFLRHPEVDYQLNGLAAVGNAPGVKSAVERAVNDAIATYLVIPNRIDVPIATLETNALHFRLPEGVVRVTVIEAQNLHNMDSGFLLQGKSDPYARVKVGSEEHKTPVIDSDLNPNWLAKCELREVTFDFPVHDVSQEISIELWDEDNDADDFLGSCKVEISAVVEEFQRWRESLDGDAGERDNDVPPKGYVENWFPLGGKGIKKGRIKLRVAWLSFSTEIEDVAQTEEAHSLNHYFLGVFLNSVTKLPNNLRGRQVYVELELSNRSLPGDSQTQQSHPSTAPDCSLAETKWFFTSDILNSNLQYTVYQSSNSRQIGTHSFPPTEFDNLLEDSADSLSMTWMRTLEKTLEDHRTLLRSTVAIRRLLGHPKAFQKPDVHEKFPKSNKGGMGKRRSSGELSMGASVINGSVVTLNNFSDDFRDKSELTFVTLTWRYSQNSEIVTVVIHDVAPDFPEGAKVKCKCGKRMADSKHHPDIKENKVEIKKCNVDSAYRIDLLVRRHGKTLGRGTVDMFNDGRQQVQIYRA